MDPDAGGLLASAAGRLAPPAEPGPDAAPAGGWTWRESDPTRNTDLRGLARLTQRFGDPRVVGPALLAGYLTGRITGLPDFSAASARVAGAALGAALLRGGLELAATAGRPGDPGSSRARARREALLPAERATFAFAAASAIDAESPARWVPWVVYPAAALAGWAEAREDGHRLGSLVAGAAVGIWTGGSMDRLERSRLRLFDRARFLVRGSPRNFRLGFRARF